MRFYSLMLTKIFLAFTELHAHSSIKTEREILLKKVLKGTGLKKKQQNKTEKWLSPKHSKHSGKETWVHFKTYCCSNSLYIIFMALKKLLISLMKHLANEEIES